MSIREALEQQLSTITPTLGTVFENDPSTAYTPMSGTPYQSCQMIYAESEDMCITNDLIKHQGIFQVTLYYPLAKGTKDIEDRAHLIRYTFTNGLKLTDASDEVRISKTPSIKNIGQVSDRFVMVVSIYWKSYNG